MASLFDRLTGQLASNEAALRIGVHGFVGALQELHDGAVTRADVIAAYGLRAADLNELDFIRQRFAAVADKNHFFSVLERILILGEEGMLGYDLKANFVARLNALA